MEWNEAPEIEAFGSCPKIEAGLARARHGTRHTALIPTEGCFDSKKETQEVVMRADALGFTPSSWIAGLHVDQGDFLRFSPLIGWQKPGLGPLGCT